MLVYRVCDGMLMHSLDNENKKGINHVGWLNDSTLVTASDDGRVKIRSTEDVRLCIFINCSELVCKSQRFCQDATTLLRTYRLPNRAIPFCFAINPHNHVITVGDSIGGVTSFHVNHSHALHHFDAHGKGVTAIAYSDDGHELVTGSKDGTLRQWIPDDEPVCFQSIIPVPRVFTGM